MLEILAWAIATPPLLALSFFSVEVLLGLRPLRIDPPRTLPDRAALLIPAHNEEASIGETVERLSRVLRPSWRLLVVADNCSDATLSRAQTAGADVVERHDSDNRGKGFALAFGRDHLVADPPEVVLIVDADCSMDRTSVEHLAASAIELKSPVQAVNLLTAPPDAAPIVQLSNFAMLIKNLVRARGLYRMAGGIPLFGTGMALPWSIFQQADLGDGDTVEDLRLSLDLAKQGIMVHLDEGATVLSPSAAAEDTVSQRRRWEHGFMQTAMKTAIPLAVSGLLRCSRHRLGLAMHLCVPPFALLLMIGCGCLVAVIGIGGLTSSWLPAILLFGGLVAALTATLMAWVKEGKSTLPLSSLARSPGYALRKLGIYIGFFTHRQAAWNRTRRTGERP